MFLSSSFEIYNIFDCETLNEWKTNSNQTENSSELNERLSESSSTALASENSSSNEVAVNYTISSPLRKTLRASFEKNDEEDDQKISATFTISPPPKPNTNTINQLANRLEKDFVLESDAGTNSVTATINVPLIPNKTLMGLDFSDKLKKTDHPSPTSPTVNQRIPPVPQPRSLFDIDNASSLKLADQIQEEANKYDANALSDSPLSEFTEGLPPSPIHHTIFGERRPSWRFKSDYSSKVKWSKIFTLTILMLSVTPIGKIYLLENLWFLRLTRVLIFSSNKIFVFSLIYF